MFPGHLYFFFAVLCPPVGTVTTKAKEECLPSYVRRIIVQASQVALERLQTLNNILQCDPAHFTADQDIHLCKDTFLVVLCLRICVEECYCSSAHQPVCDTNGRTHSNACRAECLGATVSCDQACPCRTLSQHCSCVIISWRLWAHLFTLCSLGGMVFDLYPSDHEFESR